MTPDVLDAGMTPHRRVTVATRKKIRAVVDPVPVRTIRRDALRAGMIPHRSVTMATRKNLDIDPEISALLARAEKLKTEQKISLGEIVLETGIHKLLNADQIAAVLVHARDQAKAARPQAEEAKAAVTTGSTFPAKAEVAGKPNGHTAPEPARQRPPDLLAGAAEG
jgi:hypothetical protein